MCIKRYFGGWLNVIDKKELVNIVNTINSFEKSLLCPEYSNIFKAFNLCMYEDCKVALVGQDPYPQKGVATGILFGNNSKTPEEDLSPSLKIIKEAAINFEISHYGITFDNTLESWAKQGILMLNSALTCEVNKVGSHVMLWRPFISKLLKNLSETNPEIIFVLFGQQAKTFRPYINPISDIIEIEHPSYFARMRKSMPFSIFTDINKLLKSKNNNTINWYNEY